MDRRQFLKSGLVGIAVVTADSALQLPLFLTRQARSAIFMPTVNLTMKPALLELVDQRVVFVWAYDDGRGPRTPGPVIFATEGQTVQVRITNALPEPHAFAVPGVVNSGPIAPGQTRAISFRAPPAGTHFYLDPLNAPVNRVLGLHGALVVLPAAGNTPYSIPTPSVQQLFNDLGKPPAFPGQPWTPARTFIWIFNQIDPRFNAQAQAGQTINPAVFQQTFLPSYFLINGKSGFFSSFDHDIEPTGFIGQPALIRNLNAGLVTHSPHMHGNHVYQLAINGIVQSNVILLDTWSMLPTDRRDILLPFVRPPDIPVAAFPPREEKFPLMYPMHCHTEMSQTSNGGNYPQGLITHWEILGP